MIYYTVSRYVGGGAVYRGGGVGGRATDRTGGRDARDGPGLRTGAGLGSSIRHAVDVTGAGALGRPDPFLRIQKITTAARAMNPPMLPTTIPVILPLSDEPPLPVLSLSWSWLELESEFKELLSLLSLSDESCPVGTPPHKPDELVSLKHDVWEILTAGDASLHQLLNRV